MLMLSDIDPFDSAEAKPHKNHAEIQAIRNLVGACAFAAVATVFVAAVAAVAATIPAVGSFFVVWLDSGLDCGSFDSWPAVFGV